MSCNQRNNIICFLSWSMEDIAIWKKPFAVIPSFSCIGKSASRSSVYFQFILESITKEGSEGDIAVDDVTVLEERCHLNAERGNFITFLWLERSGNRFSGKGIEESAWVSALWLVQTDLRLIKTMMEDCACLCGTLWDFSKNSTATKEASPSFLYCNWHNFLLGSLMRQR